MRVPLLDLKAQHATIRDEINDAVASVFESQQFILGPEVEAFEREVGSYCETDFAIGCASGSDALLLALMALGIGQDDEVVTVSYSFFATAGSIARLGAVPVFVDVRPHDFNIDPDQVERAITSRTRAIMPVHLFGQCVEMDRILEVAARYELPVIEDAAQAIGSRYRERSAGTLGTIGCFSFFPSKNLGAAGDAGLVTTNDPHLAAKLRILRVHGMEPKYYHHLTGVNSRIDALQAAVLRVKLRYLDEWTNARRRNAARYNALFAEAQLAGVILPVANADCRHIYNQYTIRCAERDSLFEYLRAAGIGTEVYYPVPLHLQECFAHLGYVEDSLPVTEALAREALSLPIYPELTEDMQRYVVEKVSDFYRNAS